MEPAEKSVFLVIPRVTQNPMQEFLKTNYLRKNMPTQIFSYAI